MRAMGAGEESELWGIVKHKYFDGLFLMDFSPDISDQGKVQKFGRNRRQGDVGYVDSIYSLQEGSKFYRMVEELYSPHYARKDLLDEARIEEGKKKYAGYELPGRTIGVVGLGAIGRSVANVCLDLGMKVVGYDPSLTVEGAWKLSSEVERANSLEVLLSKVDVVTFHVPLIDVTRNMINDERVALMQHGSVILNFARDGIIDDAAVCRAIKAGRIQAYVCDFPSPELAGCENVIALPCPRAPQSAAHIARTENANYHSASWTRCRTADLWQSVSGIVRYTWSGNKYAGKSGIQSFL